MITGLRTREPLGFTKFIEMIQQAAAKKGSVFFLDCKEGHEQVKNGLIASDCSGWLVPAKKRRSSMRNIWISASAIAGISILRGKPGTRTKTAS